MSDALSCCIIHQSPVIIIIAITTFVLLAANIKAQDYPGDGDTQAPPDDNTETPPVDENTGASPVDENTGASPVDENTGTPSVDDSTQESTVEGTPEVPPSDGDTTPAFDTTPATIANTIGPSTTVISMNSTTPSNARVLTVYTYSFFLIFFGALFLLF